MRSELADTLLQLVRGLGSPSDSGLVVTDLEIDMPLEVSTAVRADNRLVFLAQAPHSRWQAGFQPPIQRARIKVALEE